MRNGKEWKRKVGKERQSADGRLMVCGDSKSPCQRTGTVTRRYRTERSTEYCAALALPLPCAAAAGSGQKSGTPWARSVCSGLLGLLGLLRVLDSKASALTGKCSELEPPKGRPLSPAAGSTQEPSGESQSRAPVLFSGPQMAATHLATARSSQLAARLRARSTRQPVHAPSLPRTQPTVLQQLQKVQEEAPKHPCPGRKELSEATRPTPPSHHSIHPIRPYIKYIPYI